MCNWRIGNLPQMYVSKLEKKGNKNRRGLTFLWAQYLATVRVIEAVSALVDH